METVPDREALKLLLIEDSDTDYLLMERITRKMLSPVDIVRAANGAEIIEALRHHCDLIISDFHLPGAEGEALIKMISDAQSETPCIMLSGSSYELSSIWTPPSVIAKLEKGDNIALRAALQKACLLIGIPLSDSDHH
jgi:CheY-like chemotaxis protein